MAEHEHDHDEEPVDPLPAMIAEMDQALKTILASLPAWAEITRQRYLALIEEGFTDRQALFISAAQWLTLQTPGE